MDIFLIIFVLAILVAAVTCNLKVLHHYQMPEDKSISQSPFVKGVVVVSLTLAWWMNILLPIDVRNSRPSPGMLDMQTVWTASFGALAVFLIAIVPGTMFYYEADGDVAIKKPGRYVVCNLIIVLVVGICTISISYAFLSHAELPMIEYDCDQWLDGHSQGTGAMCDTSRDTLIKIRVGFEVYVIAALCWLGWWFFVMFGGIGLTSIPVELILAYVDRPQFIDMATYQQKKRLYGQAANGLIAWAQLLVTQDTEISPESGWRGRRKKSALRAEYNKFKRDVHLLETSKERLEISGPGKGESLAVSIAKLVLGILTALMSILWILHIVLYVVVRNITPDGVPSTTFLNDILSGFEAVGMYPMSVAFFAVFNLYLLLCVVRGCLKFGMRIFFLFSIHPMRYQATPLNSILFNVEMVLIASAAVTQFSQDAFADYARLTDAEVIFSAQIRYLSFYSFFFVNNIFVYTLLGWFVIALIYLLCRPRDQPKPKSNKKEDARLQAMANRFLPQLAEMVDKEKKNLKENAGWFGRGAKKSAAKGAMAAARA